MAEEAQRGTETVLLDSQECIKHDLGTTAEVPKSTQGHNRLSKQLNEGQRGHKKSQTNPRHASEDVWDLSGIFRGQFQS